MRRQRTLVLLSDSQAGHYFQPTSSPLEFLVGKAISPSCLKSWALCTELPFPLSFYNFFFESLSNLLQYCFCFMFWILWDLSSSTTAMWSFNHWAAREAPTAFLSDAAMQSWTEALLRVLVKWGRMVPRHHAAINHTESPGCIWQEPGLSRSPPAPCKLMLYNLGLAASCLWTIPTLILIFLQHFTHTHMHICTQTCAHIHRSAHARLSNGQPASALVKWVPATVTVVVSHSVMSNSLWPHGL